MRSIRILTQFVSGCSIKSGHTMSDQLGECLWGKHHGSIRCCSASRSGNNRFPQGTRRHSVVDRSTECACLAIFSVCFTANSPSSPQPFYSTDGWLKQSDQRRVKVKPFRVSLSSIVHGRWKKAAQAAPSRAALKSCSRMRTLTAAGQSPQAAGAVGSGTSF